MRNQLIKKAIQFFHQNKDLYNATYRLSEHKSNNDDKDIKYWINLVGKSFTRASNELVQQIKQDANNLKQREQNFIKKQSSGGKKKHSGNRRR